MQRITLIALFVFICLSATWAQSKTTEQIQKDAGEDALVLFFYRNTIRMLNQSDNKEFDALIKDIEKVKFMSLPVTAGTAGVARYKKFKSSYASENFEVLMTSRFEGKNFDVLLKDNKGNLPNTIVMVQDSAMVYILDMVGSINLNSVPTLFQVIEKNGDVSERLSGFVRRKEKGEKEKNDKERGDKEKDTNH